VGSVADISYRWAKQQRARQNLEAAKKVLSTDAAEHAAPPQIHNTDSEIQHGADIHSIAP
jgi:hypothetical protein